MKLRSQVAGCGAYLPERVLTNDALARQREPLGTADAVASAAAQIDPDGVVVVLSGDVPLVEAELLRRLGEEHAASGAAATMVTAVLDDPRGYGRVVRDADGAFVRVAETKAVGDASEAELAIAEVNTGIYAFDGAALLDALDAVGVENAQGERYLPEVLGILRERGARVATLAASDPAIVLGVNDRAGLATVRLEAQRRIQERHMLAGVTIVQPASTSIDVGVQIGEDSVIEPCTQLRRDPHRRRRHHRAPQHADRRADRRRRHGDSLASCALRGARGGERRPIRLPAAGRAAA